MDQALHSETKDSEQSQVSVLPGRGAGKMALSTGQLEKPHAYVKLISRTDTGLNYGNFGKYKVEQMFLG